MKRLMLAALVAIAACAPARTQGPAPAATPEAAYRAYWAAAPDLRDFESLGSVLTSDALAGYHEALSAEGEEMRDLAADRQRRRFEQLRIASIQIPWLVADSATLNVRLIPTDAAKEFTEPETGMVAMLREGGRWRIHFERFGPEDDGDAASVRSGSACADVIGDAGAQNVLRIRSAGGARDVRFPESILLLEDDRIRMQLPRFGMGNEYEIMAGDIIAVWGVHDIQLLGQFVSTECLPLPAFAAGERTGKLSLQQIQEQGGGARFRATFAIPQRDDPELGFFGEVEGAVIDIRTAPLAAGSVTVTNGEEEAATRIRIQHQPEFSQLEIQLGTRNRMPARLILIPDFHAAPGVYAAEPCAGSTCESVPDDRKLLAIVEEFGDGRIRAEVREVPASALGDELPSRAAAARLGALAARFESGSVVVVPTLDPLPELDAP